MIISISGKIGSGKDIIGRMIQYLVIRHENKPSSAEFMGLTPNNWEAIYQEQNFIIKRWAGKVKEIATLLTGIPIESYEDQDFKLSNLGSNWDTIVKKPGKRQDGIFGTGETMIKHMTVRELLQKIGTDAMRNNVHLNVWVNALMNEYDPILPSSSSFGIGSSKTKEENLPNWIITDTRFPNELEAVKAKKGITIRVNRDGPSIVDKMRDYSNKFNKVKQHASETALDDAEFDYTFNNNGTIKELMNKVEFMLITEKII